MKKVSLVIAVLFLFGLFFSVAAQMRGFELEGDLRGMIKERLNLTKDQENKVEKIHFKYDELKIDLKSQIEKNRLEIKRLMSDDNVDTGKLMSLTEKENQLHSEMRTNMISGWVDIYNILDDSQKETWKEVLSRIMDFGPGKGMVGKGKRGKGMRFNRGDFPRQPLPDTK